MGKKFTPYKSKTKLVPPVAPAINMHTIEKYVENTRRKAWDDAVEVVSSAFHIVLSDKNGLTTEQLKKVSDDVFSQLECVVGGYVTVDELKQVCSELGVPTDVINHDNITKSIEETKSKLKEYEEMKKVATSADELLDKEKKTFIEPSTENEIKIERMTKITGKFGTYIANNGIITVDGVENEMNKEQFMNYIKELQIVGANI